MLFVDISGQRFGRLTVLSLAGQAKDGRFRWLCRCDCGTYTIVRGPKLRSGRTQSCGCLKLDRKGTKNPNFKHGLSFSPEWHSWDSMIQRCENLKHTSYKNYGARGIKVCDRWHSFENFVSDMGRRPSGHTLDRINNDGNYEPGNVKWSTPKEQAGNRRPPLKRSHH